MLSVEHHASETHVVRLPTRLAGYSREQVDLLSVAGSLPALNKISHAPSSRAKIKSDNHAWNNYEKNKGCALSAEPPQELIVGFRILIQEIILAPRKANQKSRNDGQGRSQKP